MPPRLPQRTPSARRRSPCRVNAIAGVLSPCANGALTLTVAMLAVAWPDTAAAYSRALEVDATATLVFKLSIPTGTTVSLSTDSPAGVDPMLYLLRDDVGGWLQVAENDDAIPGSELDPSLTYTNNSNVTEFMVILRSWDAQSAGTTDLYLNGQLHWSGVPVGGAAVWGQGFNFGAGDEIRTSLRPGGSIATVLLALSGTTQITNVASLNAVGGDSMLSMGTQLPLLFVVATPHVLDATSYLTPRAGTVVLAANDVANDVDQDGVGDGLEAELGTCPLATCTNAHHGRDTDRDGLSDFEELFGVPGTLGDGSDDLNLSRWGASPLHKDVFVEVDHLHDVNQADVNPANNLPTMTPPMPFGTNPFQRMRDHPGTEMHNWRPWTAGWGSGSLEDWVTQVRSLFLAGPADHLHNPDGAPGVRVHLDLGVPPNNPADEQAFGDYGPSSARAVAQDFILRFDATIAGNVSVQINGSTSTFDATSLSREQICQVVALWVLLLDSGQTEPVYIKYNGCSGGGTPRLTVATKDETLGFTRQVTLPPAAPEAIAVEDELADAIFAHKGVSALRASNRRGVLRYGVIIDVASNGGKGEDEADGFVSDISPNTFAHELGHTLRLQHWGHDAWGTADVQCIPHYASLMSRLPGPGFSAVDSPIFVLPHATVEDETFGAGYDYSRFVPWPFWFTVAGSAVDWNRDGIPGGSPRAFRSFAMAAVDSNCKAFVTGQTTLVPAAQAPEGVVDLVRMGSYLYALWPDASGDLMVASAPLGAVGNKGCTGSANPLHKATNPCLTFSAPAALTQLDGTVGVTAQVFGGELFVAATSDPGGALAGRFEVFRFSQDPATGALSLQGSQVTPATGGGQGAGNPSDPETSVHAPELVLRHASTVSNPLGLLYLAKNGDFASFGWDGAQWLYEGPLVDVGGSAITGDQPPAAKAWPDPGLGWNANEHRTLAILPGAQGALRVYVLEPATGQWRDLQFQGNTDPAVGRTEAKPFLEYRLLRTTTGQADAEFSGHFMIGVMAPHGSAHHTRAYVQFSELAGRNRPPGGPLSPNLQANGARDWLQNNHAVSLMPLSAVLYSDGSTDNVFGLLPLDTPNADRGLNFLPHADGSPAQPLQAGSDFRVMEDGICNNIAGERTPAFTCGAINVLD